MLETYAYKLMNLGEFTLTLIGFGVVAAGFGVGLLLRTGARLSIKRMPYIFWVGSTYFLISVVPLAWVLTFDAIEKQILWALTSFIYSCIFLFGVACAVLAHGRSVNAYGTGGRAWYALIPIINLELFFREPLDREPVGLGDQLRNGLGVTFGLTLLLLGTVLDKLVNEQIDLRAQEAEFDESMQASSIDMMVRSMGLEEALRQIASETPGQSIDDQTILMGVRSEGAVLSYFYQMETDEVRLPDHMRMEIAQYNCDYVPLYPVIKAGGTIEDVYMREDGVELGRVSVTRESCSF